MTDYSDWEGLPSLKIEPELRLFERYKLALGLYIASVLITWAERGPARIRRGAWADYKLTRPRAPHLKARLVRGCIRSRGRQVDAATENPTHERNDVIKIETCPNGTVRVSPAGDLDWTNATALRHAAHELLELHLGAELDLHDVVSIDAVGISALLGSVRLIRSAGGKVRITNMNPQVRSRLQLLSIDPEFQPATRNCGNAA